MSSGSDTPDWPEPAPLYTAQQTRELDRQAIEVHGIPGLTLMQRAGAFAFDCLRQGFPGARRVVVVCGPGNNGGDGHVVARLAHEAGLSVRVLMPVDPSRLRGDAATCAEERRLAGVADEPWRPEALEDADLVVDALLGTGLDRPVKEELAAVIGAINRTGTPVLAIDIPSGLNADTGQPMGCAVRARLTATFIGRKRGLYTGEGPEHAGEIRFDDLGVPGLIYEAVPTRVSLLGLADLLGMLGPRPRTAHKGHFGHVLVVGGAPGYSGAARMAGEAAMRTGAGLVSLATHPAHAAFAGLLRPELMCHAVSDPEGLGPLLERATVVAVGPGLGQGEWGGALLARLLEWDGPLVADADALNLLAAEPCRREDWVLTPHPGEAARLLGCPTAAVQADRFAAADELGERYGGTIVLKGAGTLVREPAGGTGVCPLGNPGMASGGMGDVLTGVIAGLIAQGLAPPAAAALGVCLHAAAADLAAREGERGLLAGDVVARLRTLVNHSC
ncbi:MAG: NAD(P)H-hydrate dehydratase [Gammaproteobacteria bacterium]|nr:MAG: NAD(P)H-hydrate dehydratase [Gammaproteobacteria bacterium]